MRIQVLGAHNTVSMATGASGLLVDGVLALDAGSLASRLSFAAQTRVTDLLITHGHYDHIRDVPAFAMNLFLRHRSVTIHCTAEVREMLLACLMNGRIYPDFTAKPAEAPTVRFHLVEPGRPFAVRSYTVTPVPMLHALPTVGYEVRSADGKKVFYTGDTGPDLAATWRQTAPDLLIIEVTASNRWEGAARESLHLAPALFQAEMLSFRGIHGYLPRVVAVHLNPELESEIRTELAVVAGALGMEIILARERMVLTV